VRRGDSAWIVLERGVREVEDRRATAKSFNANYAVLYDRLGEARERPCNLWCGDEEAREVVERLNRDGGYEPVYAGPLENAAAQEGFMTLVFAIEQGGLGPFVYRMAPPDRL